MMQSVYSNVFNMGSYLVPFLLILMATMLARNIIDAIYYAFDARKGR